MWKDSQGRWLTTGLFAELAASQTFVKYNLKEARALYLSTNDPTGYKFATEYLGGWQHWLAMKASPRLAPILQQWEDELEVKLRCENIQNIVKIARGDKGYQAAKYLADGGWKPKEVGRPTKEKVNQEARIRSKMYDEFGGDIVEFKK